LFLLNTIKNQKDNPYIFKISPAETFKRLKLFVLSFFTINEIDALKVQEDMKREFEEYKKPTTTFIGKIFNILLMIHIEATLFTV